MGSLKDLMKKAKDLPEYDFDRRLNSVIRNNSKYRNLDSSNKKIIEDLVDKYKPKLRRGIKIGYVNRRNDLYKLTKNRVKLGLTREDLKDIKEVIDAFK